MKNHKRSTRLFVNAGMIFPACAANAELLDLDKAHWRMDIDKEVDCKNCLSHTILGLRELFRVE